MHPQDTHTLAVEYANNHTRYFYGDDSVPCVIGSKAHKYWLSQYDAVVRHHEEEG